MRPHDILRYSLLAIGLALLVSCSNSCRTADTPTDAAKGGDAKDADTAPLQTGLQPFSFDYHAVTELLLVKSDPDSGDRWAARLFKATPKSGAEEWRIESAGGELASLIDTRADGYFVLHLLDTLRSLRVERADVPGTPESLGLVPPRFALKWKVASRELEVRIGAKAAPDSASATAKAQSAGAIRYYASIPGQKPFVADGATLQMLAYIPSFSHLRLKTWSGVVADDIDEIELKGAGGGFYAQREGAEWTDRKHRRLKADVSQWLEQLTHERVLEFVDDPGQAKRLTAHVRKSPLLQATLKNRHGQPTQLAIAQVDGQWFALSSARPDGVFKVYPGSRDAMVPPRR
jgi:hypothetical protein